MIPFERDADRRRGDDQGVMPSQPPLDDRTADAVLSGRTSTDDRPDLAALADLVDGLRHASQATPGPTPELQRLLAEGISTDESELPVTAASDVHGPATPQVSGPPKWRTDRMIEIVAAKIAAAGLAAKAGVASAAVLAATAGAGAAGALPDALQGPLDELRDRGEVEQILIDDDGLEQVDAVEAPPEDLTEEDAAEEDVAEDAPETDTPDEDAADGDDRFGERVSEDARDPESPGVDGPTIADEASEGRSTEARERATDARERAADASEGRSNAGHETSSQRRPADVPAPAAPPADAEDEDEAEAEDEGTAGAATAEQRSTPGADRGTRGAPSGTPGR